MGVSKNKKKKSKDGPKPKNLHQKCEKEKRLSTDNKLESENTITGIFKVDEQHELKKILKVNNLTSMPLILGAVILGKFDVVKKLIKQGHDVNATGFDKTSPVMWAVKAKNLEMIDLLVSRGADVFTGVVEKTVDDSAENIIFTALNSTDWDENCFLDFWQSVKKMNEVNLEVANKTGNRILHFAVKRQWGLLIESLIEDKVNINSCNNKGVSALTMAAARNDLKLVNILLKANANVFQEDFKGNTPICYTIVNIVRKNMNPPYETFDRLTKNFTREKYERYIDRRLYLLLSPPNNDLNLYYSNINKITTSVVSFIMKEIPNGADILFKLHAFEKLKRAIEIHIKHFDYLQALLSVLSLLLRWCDCCTKIRNVIVQNDISERFVQSSLANTLSSVLRVYNGSIWMKQLLPNVFLPLFLTCSQSLLAKKWLKDHLEELEKYYQQYLDICLVNFNIKEDEKHVQVIKDKIKSFKDTFDELKSELIQFKESEALSITESKEKSLKDEEKFEQPAQHGRKYAKRMRRKARALKARIDKIRSADVVQRIRKISSSLGDVCETRRSPPCHAHTTNRTNRSSSVDNSNETINDEQKIDTSEDEEIIEIKLNHSIDSSSTESEERPVIVNNAMFVNNFITNSNSNGSGFYDGTLRVYLDDKESENRKAEFGAALIRLKIMLNDIICKYKFLWALDANMGHPHFLGGCGDYIHLHTLLEGTREEQLEKLKPLLPFIEQQYLAKLVDNFNKTLEKIRHLFLQNNENYKLLTEQLKNLLTEHEIRGEKYLKKTFDKSNDEPYDEEVVPGKFGAIGLQSKSSYHFENGLHLRSDMNFCSEGDEPFNEDLLPGRYGAIGDHLRAETLDIPRDYQGEISRNISPPTYMDLIENILPPKYPQPATQLSPQDILYLNEMSAISFKQSNLTKEEKEEIKKKTEDNAYHLVKSACSVCESDNIFEGWDEEFISPYMRRMMQKAKEKKERSFPIQRSNMPPMPPYKQAEPCENPEKCGEIVPYSENPNPPEMKKEDAPKTSRWESRIHSLQTIIKQQLTTKGRRDVSSNLIVTSSKYCTERFALSAGGHFGRVELGFDKNGKPVIIKRICAVTVKQIYACIHSVLGVRHRHILSYTICSLDSSTPSLLLGTPLCEYNLGEYVMMLKAQHTAPAVAAGLAFQFLLGLQHLHRSKPAPIVHGNLKPSNVLIDLRGKVRLAEFGLYQTLYIRERAPKSSLIWFARETYEVYELRRGGMHCTLATDMQVAGMLLHFTLTWGLHVFGTGADDILCNLVAGRPKIQDLGADAQDLISWMVVYERGDRPHIAQVLNHIYFWPESEKWRFLLTCSGLTETGSPVPHLPLQSFHTYLEIFSKKHGIVGDWIPILKRRYPSLDTSLAVVGTETDTPIGVLKFVRRMVLDERQDELRDLILRAFPALPLSLFRLIENTEWLNHPAFQSFFRY